MRSHLAQAVSQTLSVWTEGRVLLPLIPRRATVYALLRYDNGYPTGCLFSSRVEGLGFVTIWTNQRLEAYTRSSLGLLWLRQAPAEMKFHGAVTLMLPEVVEAHEVTTGEVTLDSGLLLSCIGFIHLFFLFLLCCPFLVPFLIFPFLSFLSLAVGVTQASAWARILHELSNAAVLAESSRSSHPEARKSLLASFPFSATFSQLCDP